MEVQPVTVDDQPETGCDSVPLCDWTHGGGGREEIDIATFKTGHKWLQMITEFENKCWETKKKKRVDHLRERWEEKKSGILLSSDKYLMRKDMKKLNLAKNEPAHL